MSAKTVTGVHIDENALIAEQTQDERETQRKATENLMHDTELEQLKAERDALNAQIRAATRKTAPAKPPLTLTEVEAHQAEKLNIYAHDVLAPLVAQRVKAGDTPEHAWQALTELYAPTVLAAVALHEESPDLSWDECVSRALGRPRTHRTAKEAK